jgi:hypothetical protein
MATNVQYKSPGERRKCVMIKGVPLATSQAL